MLPRRTTAEDHLDMLVGLQNRLGKVLAPHEEFVVGVKTYYLSPGGFLYRKKEDLGSGGGRGYFCGYLDDEVWNHRKTYLNKDSI